MIEKQPKPDWAPLSRPGCEEVQFRVLLEQDGLILANLKFAETGTIDKHDAPFDIDVICISGSGFTSIDDETFPISQGETVRWPKNHQHCLWTLETTMETLMVEHVS